MKDVTVLINCRNGAKYLQKTFSSLKAQSYKNFKVLFVDNRSSDDSINIVSKFENDIEIRVLQTPYPMTLGAARAYGVEFIDTNYFTILDTDDIYLENTLQLLYDEIRCNDFSVVYGHQLLINEQDDIIGRIMNRYAGTSGDFFEKLLWHWDIPIVGVIVSTTKIRERKINFDEIYLGSEEFDFFLRVSAFYPFKAINNVVVKYRVHPSLSSSLGDRRELERRMALENLQKLFPNYALQYAKAFQYAFAKCDYYKSLRFIEKKEFVNARRAIAGRLFYDWRYFAFYLATFLPKFCILLLRLKYKNQLNLS